MEKKEILSCLVALEDAFVSGEWNKVWTEGGSFPVCWEILKCKKKRCPAYGRRNIRCWHVAGTFCNGGGRKASLANKWHDCRDCKVFKRATDTENKRVHELFNNIVFSVMALDPAALTTMRLMKKYLTELTVRYSLTTRQQEVLRLALSQLRREEIADALGISDETVKMHLKHIHRKFEVASRSELQRKIARYCERLHRKAKVPMPVISGS